MDAPPTDREPVLRVPAMPRDANSAGDVFGGWIMAQVDLAGSIPAQRRARGRVVTVAVNAFEFHQPVFIGDLVSCYAGVTRVGTTSITVEVEVWAERDPAAAEHIKVTQATLVYVAVDGQGRPRPVAAGAGA